MLTEKMKTILLLISFPFVGILLYSSFLSETIILGKEIEKVKINIERTRDLEVEWAKLNKEVAKQEEILRHAQATDSLDLFFSDISKYCEANHVTLTDYPSLHSIKQKEYTCNTRIVTFEASFHSLLRLIDHVEREKRGQLKALCFNLTRTTRNRPPCLQLILYVQSISL